MAGSTVTSVGGSMCCQRRTNCSTASAVIDRSVSNSHRRASSTPDSVSRAAEDAALSDAPEPVVLLSPACASFDQYKSFELRGDQFRDLVGALPDMQLNPRATS